MPLFTFLRVDVARTVEALLYSVVGTILIVI